MPDLDLAVTPRAATDRVGPVVDGRLRVRVTRPPADGEANRAVIRLAAEAIGIPRGQLEIVAGERARRKRLRVHGITPDELARRLAALPAD